MKRTWACVIYFTCCRQCSITMVPITLVLKFKSNRDTPQIW